jgi:2-polyprenyl-3-methyl-5-hydroxy-6-metoxy-1,4-benzoquinol methylase
MIYAEDGFSGLSRRAAAKCLRVLGLIPPVEETARAAAARKATAKQAALARQEQRVADFLARTRNLGIPDLEHFYWYHTIDLGNGLVTPGEYDYRTNWSRFHFPEDMQGLSVLDVGSATGFFAFEFEKRGADVVSVELPSVADWDVPAVERERVLQYLMSHHRASTPEEVYHRHLDGPFLFCRQMLGSKVQRCYSTINDLTPAKLGRSSFDLIFLGDVLVHLFSPLKALDVLAPLCRGTLVVTNEVNRLQAEGAVMHLLCSGQQRNSSRAWWMANDACLREMLQRVGFRSVSVVGQHAGCTSNYGFDYNRLVIHACK